MKNEKSHITFFMLLVYVLSFTMTTIPAMTIGAVSIKKECPNNRTAIDSETGHHVIKNLIIPTEHKSQSENPVEVSICSSTFSFILTTSVKEINLLVVDEEKTYHPQSFYLSPILEKLKNPPRIQLLMR